MNPKRWEEEIDYGLINYLFKTRRGPSKELLSLSFSLLNLFSWLMHGFCAVVCAGRSNPNGSGGTSKNSKVTHLFRNMPCSWWNMELLYRYQGVPNHFRPASTFQTTTTIIGTIDFSNAVNKTQKPPPLLTTILLQTHQWNGLSDSITR